MGDDNDDDVDVEASENRSDEIGQWANANLSDSAHGLRRRNSELPDSSTGGRSYGSSGESPPHVTHVASHQSLSRPPMAPTRPAPKPVVVSKHMIL